MMNFLTTGQILARPKVTLLVLACGIAGSASIGIASAATPEEEAPHMVLYYNPESLETDRGARAMYHKIVHAAEEVCPNDAFTPRIVTDAMRTCREESIARAVRDVHSSKVAALYAASSKPSSKHGHG